MGHNVDLRWLLGLPDYVKCPECNKNTKSWFDDYDIDCGEPNACEGIMTLAVQCDHCESEIEYKFEIRIVEEKK